MESRAPDVDDYASLFFAFAPIALDLDAWLRWRAERIGRGAGPSALGDVVPLDRLTTFEARPILWTLVFETALRRARTYPGTLERLAPESSVAKSLTAAVATLGADGEPAAWLLASGEVGPCLVLACAFRGERPLQSDVATALIAASARAADAPLGGDVPEAVDTAWRAAGSAEIRGARTFVVAVYRAAPGDPILTAGDGLARPYADVHQREEGDVTNRAADYANDDSTLSYAHVGFSFATLVARRPADAMFFLPAASMAQLSWALQRELEDALRARPWAPSETSPTAASRLRETFERTKLELTMLEIGRQAFREGLRPWQHRFLRRFTDDWQIDASHALLIDAVENVSSFLEARVTLRQLDDSNRQAAILFVIALLGVLGLVSTFASYSDLLHDVLAARGFYANPFYPTGVVLLFAVTLVLTAAGIVVGFRSRR